MDAYLVSLTIVVVTICTLLSSSSLFHCFYRPNNGFGGRSGVKVTSEEVGVTGTSFKHRFAGIWRKHWLPWRSTPFLQTIWTSLFCIELVNSSSVLLFPRIPTLEEGGQGEFRVWVSLICEMNQKSGEEMLPWSCDHSWTPTVGDSARRDQ